IKPDPVQAFHNLQLHNLLIWQAERCFLDHWYARKPKEPYYKQAGELYLEDAKRLVTGTPGELDSAQQDARWQDVKKAGEFLLPKHFTITGIPLVDWTSERSLEMKYDMEAPKEVLPGYPVVWRKPQKPLALAENESNERVVVEEFAGEKKT